ncbi:MAG: sulfite exporter TauE/SafE family protein [Candidatus Kapaibacterium sp.]
MTIVLYGISFLIGISLGMLGAGGAIVAVPAMVYLGGIDPDLAGGYALFMVTVSSAIASVQHIRQRLIDGRALLEFGLPTVVSMFVVRQYVAPHTDDRLQMISFGIILMYVAIQMFRAKGTAQSANHRWKLSGFGVLVGFVSGILGVGGGFLITPALVLLAGLDMKRAVATSLVLICINSAVGVSVDLNTGLAYDWPLVLSFTGLMSVGIYLGTIATRWVKDASLRKAFGWVVLATGIAVLLRELSTLL